ncbi:MAG: hypothetical protein ABIS86_08065 [Streptosporangiaceae bacterium]
MEVGTGSQAGSGFKEELFGQSTEAVGRTSTVTGSLTIAGSRVDKDTFTVDLASMSSDTDDVRRGRVRDRRGRPQAHPVNTIEAS